MMPVPEVTVREDSEAAGEGSRQKPTERAFVVQFDPIADARSRLRGRVELIASGEATRFRSLKQLVSFMTGALRKQTSDPQRSEG